MSMRIVITSDLYTPMTNGVAISSRRLAQGLSARGHEVLVLAPSQSGKYHAGLEDGVSVARLSSRKMPLYPDQIKKVTAKYKTAIFYKNGLRVSFAPYRDMRRALGEFRPDVLHNQTPGPIGLAALRYARKYGVPIVATLHAYPDNFTGQFKLLRFAKKPSDALVRKYFARYLKNADYATMPTQMAIDDLAPPGSVKVPVEALSNGIDFSRFKPADAPQSIYALYKIPQGRPIMGYVGRVDPEKSLEVLVRAFARVQRDVSEALLVIVGDGTDRKRLAEMAGKLGIAASVKFLGPVVGENLPVLYRTFDVFAITSRTETQSLVLMEAMATGLPVAAVKAGAVGELVVNGKNGFLCAPGDVRGVAEALAELLLSKDLRTRYGQASLEIIAKHDIGHTVRRLEEIYLAVMKSESDD